MKTTNNLLLFLLITSFISSGYVQAAGSPVQIYKLEVNIWPEYDRPETLVIYRITLSADTHLPAQISLRIPRAAGSPFKVAIKDLDGLLYDLEYTLVPEGDWNRIVFISPGADLQVEYYDPGIQVDVTQRTITYRWIGDYALRDLDVIVQQPRGASALSILPSLGQGHLNPDDELVYYESSMGSLDAGVAFNLTVTYQKKDDSLSATLVSVKPAGQFPVRYTFKDRMNIFFTSIVHERGLAVTGVLILAWLVLFLVTIWLAGSPVFNRFRRRPKPAAIQKDGNASPPVYCSQCGKKAHPGDIYCRVCGSKLPAP
jgi:hypothetical protein